MKRFIQGVNREQASLPERLDDFIADDNTVRVIDFFVDKLKLDRLGFKGVEPHPLGRPAYHPADMLKLYIYGYFYRIPSSRRLEQETQRNVEVMWLLKQLTPDFKTIADFRKNNGKAIKRVCHQFTLLCQKWELLSPDTVAIDGSKFKAVNNRDKNFTPAKVQLRQKRLMSNIESYLDQLESADRGELVLTDNKVEWLRERIAFLNDELERLRQLNDKLQQCPDKQLSLTDPDARSMKIRGTGIVGYNVQTAVEAKNHLIVYHDVINSGSDRHQLFTMAFIAKAVLKADKLTAIADRGYYKGEEILFCEQSGITTMIPKTHTSSNEAAGLFRRESFRYQPATDEYTCPAEEHLIWRFRTVEHGKTLDCYWSSACKNCPIKSRCTTGKQRRIKRWIHEDVLDTVQQRLEQTPDSMRIRRETVEHPFGTIKAWMGYTHFLTKRLPKVRTEMSLLVLSYNLKRVINIIGVPELLALLSICLILSIRYKPHMRSKPTM